MAYRRKRRRKGGRGRMHKSCFYVVPGKGKFRKKSAARRAMGRPASRRRRRRRRRRR